MRKHLTNVLGSHMLLVCCRLLQAGLPFWLQTVLNLDGPAIRNANRGDSRESFRRKIGYFRNVRVICANRLKPAIRNF